MTDTPPVECHFSIRRPAADNRWHYEPVYFDSWYGTTFLPLWDPPAVGDLTTLAGQSGPPAEGGPVFLVVGRMWVHPEYGSPAWPYGTPRPLKGPSLDVIVEPAEGPYLNQSHAAREEEEV